MKFIFLNTKNLKNEILIFFFQNINIRTRSEITESELKNTRNRPEVQKYPNGFYTSIPLYPKIRNTQSEPGRVPEGPLLTVMKKHATTKAVEAWEKMMPIKHQRDVKMGFEVRWLKHA